MEPVSWSGHEDVTAVNIADVPDSKSRTDLRTHQKKKKKTNVGKY